MESKKIKILAIDDNKDNLISLKALIKDEFPDAITFTALNGTKGIELAAKENPDVILLDIVMPDMDGYEVCHKLKADDSLRDIPVVFVTSIKDDRESRIRALECGAEGFLAKPIDESELIAQIRAMVKIKEATAIKRNEKEHLKVLVQKQTQELKIAYKETLKLLDEVKKENQERKLAEKALKMSEERFKLLFEKAPLGYQALDIDGNFIDVNQQWLDTLGRTREEVIGKWFGDFISPAYQDDFRKHFPIFKAQGHIHSEFEMVHKNGNILFIAFDGKIGYDLKGEFKQTHCILQDITEVKLTQEKLKKSEERLRMVVDATPFPIALVDTNDDIIKYWSRSAIELFGHTALTTDEWYKIAYPDDKYRHDVIERWKLSLEKARQTKEPVNTGEYRVACSDGSVLICELYANFIEENLIVTFNNITERKQAEKALLESQHLFQALAHVSPVGIFRTDKDGHTIYVNPKWLELSGLDIEEAADFGWLKAVHPDDREQLEESWKSNAKSQLSSIAEYRFLRPDGTTVWVMGNAAPQLINNEIVGYIGTITDITERKWAENEIHHERRLLRTLIDGLPDLIYVKDIECRKVVANIADIRNIGYETEDEVLGKTDLDLFSEDIGQRGYADDKEVINSGVAILEQEEDFIDKLGIRHWFVTSKIPLFDKDGKITGLVGIGHDITRRKSVNEELIKAKEKAEESERLKSAFLANMSHEIRTPMNGILGFTELLKDPNLSTDDQLDFIQTIQISGERMLNTINNIVNVSKIESGLINVVLDDTNINKKIEFTYKFFKPEVEKKGLQFKFKNGLPTEDAVIRTDNEKVYGVLTNLIKNAIKFTYDGSIELGYVLKSDREPAELEFYVKDTGVGIPKHHQQIIFERFRQGSYDLNRLYEGSGLGLSIAKSYVEMLGGKIWVESEEGRGSTFYFTIPYQSVEKAKTEIKGVDADEIKEVQLKNLKILIVEDDEVSYSLLKRTIQKIGKEVMHAITGFEAIEACRQNPDLDLVLMDIRMPLMDGNEATRQIRQFNKDVIIIAQTAYAFAGDSEKAIEAGCNDYITKPINMALLFELIKKHVKKL